MADIITVEKNEISVANLKTGLAVNVQLECNIL